MTHEEIAQRFLQMAGSGQVEEAYERFIAPDFIHHVQHFQGDRQSLADAMAQAHQESPNRALDVVHTYEDGDTVITHSRVVKDELEVDVVHIFRFRDDVIVELWAVGQKIDPDSPNQHGNF